MQASDIIAGRWYAIVSDSAWREDYSHSASRMKVSWVDVDTNQVEAVEYDGGPPWSYDVSCVRHTWAKETKLRSAMHDKARTLSTLIRNPAGCETPTRTFLLRLTEEEVDVLMDGLSDTSGHESALTSIFGP